MQEGEWETWQPAFGSVRPFTPDPFLRGEGKVGLETSSGVRNGLT